VIGEFIGLGVVIRPKSQDEDHGYSSGHYHPRPQSLPNPRPELFTAALSLAKRVSNESNGGDSIFWRE
jgi:hypothetical protein